MRATGESPSAYMKRRFAEATDFDMLDEIDYQLRDEGEEKDNIKVFKSKRRKELQRQKPTTAVTRFAGQLPAEAIVDGLPWPTSVDGEVNPAFVAGMRYEAMNVIRGIRMAQELNKMGLEQAKPVIEMAKEMRQAEGQAAQTIAAQFGQVTMQSNQQILSAIHQLAAAQAQGQPPASDTNPMVKAIFSAMQPYVAQTVGQIFSSIFKRPQPGTPPQSGQAVANPPLTGQPMQQTEPESPPPHSKPGEEGQWTEA